jgi:methanethiol S-methyltransferase
MLVHLAPAIVMIIIASWIFYAFAGPKKGRDWTGAGLIQAFIISLYAEMFGFPLTLYVVTRVFGWDAAWLGQTKPLWSTMLQLDTSQYMPLFMGVGNLILISGWRNVYRARREGRLAMDGIYAHVRHPQYTGIILMVLGEGVIHWPTPISLALFPLIVAAYTWLAIREEKELLRQFGESYRRYKDVVPMLIPRLSPARKIARPRERTKV